MSVETIVINLAFIAAAGVLFKPLTGAIKSFLSVYSSKIGEEIHSVELRLSNVKESLTAAMNSNLHLNDEVEQVLTDAKFKAAAMLESGKQRVNAELTSSINRARTRILDENRHLMLALRLSLLDELFGFLSNFGGKSLKKVEHEALVMHMAEQLSGDSLPHHE